MSCPQCLTSLTSKTISCQKCPLKFCKHICLYGHISEAHAVLPKSPFITSGTFLTNFPTDAISKTSDYNISNMEILRDKKNKLKIIGQGAFGELRLAKQKVTNEQYAIKLINKSKVKEAGVSLEIIKREIAIHMRITHPNIVKLYSYSEDENNYYMIMEYISNGTWFHQIQNHRGWNEEDAFQYFIQITNAIWFLHQQGFVHRDIKPENIWIDENNNVKLCDFGWCVSVNNGSRQTFCGTYEYMAPEIVNDQQYDYSIDVWSLGVLLYEMTHGYSPFRAKGGERNPMKEIFNNINKKDFIINKDLSKDCCDWLKKLLTKDKNNRIRVNEIFESAWVVKREGSTARNVDWGVSSLDCNGNRCQEQINKFDVEKEKKNASFKWNNNSGINTINNELNNNITTTNSNSYIINSSDSIKNEKIFNDKKSSNTNGYEPNTKYKLKDNDKIVIKDKDCQSQSAVKKSKQYYDELEAEEDKKFLECLLGDSNSNQTIDKFNHDKNNKKGLNKQVNVINATNNQKMAQSIRPNDYKFHLNDMDLQGSDEFAFLRDLNQTRCTTKKIKDQTKTLNLNFLPKELWYQETNYHESTQNILKTIDWVERAQKIQEERKKMKMEIKINKDAARAKKEEKEGFWDNFFKCGECTS